MKAILITIDGPAGAGKTFISKKLADLLAYNYVDTGALYRGLAFSLIEKGIDMNNEKALADFLQNLKIELFFDESREQRLKLDSVDITDKLRSNDVSVKASLIAALPLVRDFLLSFQRRLGEKKAVVFEGRDMGSVVFPEAELKFYLDADIRVRAMRRFKQVQDSSLSFEELMEDMKKRDKRDRERKIAPLLPAGDAFVIDSSELSIDEVLALMMDRFNRKNSLLN